MSTSLTLIDAFTALPFSGNQAAVAVLAEAPPEPWMRAVANELQLSETAFCWPEGTAHRLRWFTPTVEVDLCGHATVAAAATLWADGHLHRDEPAEFLTRSGQLSCRRTATGEIDLDLPGYHPRPTTTTLDWSALGLPRIPQEILAGPGPGDADYLIAVLGDADQVLAAKIVPSVLARSESRPLILTAEGDGNVDIVSRVFAPTLGVPEDPVTGSAHSLLAPYWADRLGREVLACHQASARGGDLRATVADDRVILAARAVVVGHLILTQVASPQGWTC